MLRWFEEKKANLRRTAKLNKGTVTMEMRKEEGGFDAENRLRKEQFKEKEDRKRISSIVLK